MKKIIFILFLLGLSAAAFGQQRSTLRGRVIDTATGEPLFGATVVVDSLQNGMVAENGSFTVTNIPRGEATVEIFSLGYVTAVRKVNFNRATVDIGTVDLAADESLNLGEAVVTGVPNPVIQRGDTTQFNAAAFKTNPDAYAGDLVAKMPGMEVSESGVTAQGEAVARVYLNNELFYGDDAMTALSNLPADLVESIQMFDELPDETRFSGFNDGRTQRALNIVTKEKFKVQVDMRLTAGYGQELQRDMDGKYQPRYNTNGMLNILSAKTQFNVSGVGNNVGGGGGFGGGFGGGGGSGLRSSQNIGSNFSTRIDSLSTLSIEYSYRANQTRNNSLTLRDYYPVEGVFDSRFTRDTLSSHSGSGSHSIRTEYEYEGKKDRVDVRLNGSLGNNDSDSFGITEEARNSSPYSLSERWRESEGDSRSVNGMINWSHRLGQKPGRVFSLQANFSLSENTSDGIENTDLALYYENRDTLNYWNNNSDRSARNFGLSFNYNEPLSDQMRLNFNYRPSYSYSSSERLRVDQFEDLVDTLVSERMTYDYLVHTGRIGLSFNKQDHFNFSVSLSAESASRAQTMTLPRDFDMERSFTRLLPTFSFRYYVNRVKYFQAQYSTSSTLPSLEQLSTVIDVSDPTRYSAGNADLKQDYTHRLNVRYNSNNFERSTNFYAGLSGSLTTNSIQRRTIYFTEDTVLPEYGGFVFSQGTTLSTYVNAGSGATLNANAGYSLVFKPLKTNVSISGSYSYRHTPSYVGPTLITENVNTEMLSLQLTSNVSENVDFTVRASANYSTTDNERSAYRENYGGMMMGMVNYIFGGGFVFNTNYMLRASNTQGAPFHVWSASIGRKFLKNNAAEFRIEFNDILNQARSYSYSYGQQFETESWNRVMGRYIMARVTYRFNSLRNNSSSRTQQQGPNGRGGREGRPDGGNFQRGGNAPDGGGFPGGGGNYPMMPGGGGGFPGGGGGGRGGF